MLRLDIRIALLFGWAIAFAAAPSTLRGQATPAVQRPTFWGTIALGQAGITDSGGILAGYATTPPAQIHFSIAGGLAIVHDINDAAVGRGARRAG